MSKLKELREQRAKIHAEAVAILQLPTMTKEDRIKYDAIQADIDVMTGDIDRIIRSEKLEAELRSEIPTTPIAGSNTEDSKTVEARQKEYRAAFFDQMRWGNPGNKWQRGASEENLAKLVTVRNKMARCTKEEREQFAGTQSVTYTEGTVGGFFVPAGFVYDVEVATRFYAPLLDGSTVRILETATGQVLPYPTSNDTNQAWAPVGEGVQVNQNSAGEPGTVPNNYPSPGVTAPSGTAGDVLLGHVNFGAIKGSTGLIRISLELLQDSAFNLESFLSAAFAVRLGRGYEWYLTNGTGNGTQPTGLLVAIANSGVTPTVATGSSTNDGVVGNTGVNSIGWADLVNLEHSVDPTYRRSAKYMFHDQTLRFLKNVLDKYGRPLWVPGIKDGEPDTLNGYPYVINQSFPQIGASATTVAFGAFEKFLVRKVKDLQVVRLDERFADFGEVAYVGFSRIDSNLIDAGTHPLNVLQQHS